MDRAAFYAALRKRDSGLFGTSLSQSQVNGLERLLNTWAQYYASDPIEFLAYDLATSYHETGATMQPITERGARSYFNKYEPGTKLGKILGNTVAGDGYKFRGGGDVQNTGRANAARATKELNALFGLGIDLVADPDKRGDPFVSAHSLFLGNKAGWWTGKKLGDYIKPGVKIDFLNARRVVNGTDKAAQIAGYADCFMGALKAGAVVPDPGPVVEPIQPAPTPSPIPIPATPEPEAHPSLWAALAAIFISIFKKG